MRMLALALLVFAALAAPAAAQYAEPLPPGTWLVPADGAMIHASSWPAATPSEMQSFTIYTGDYATLPYDFDVDVATSPGTDPQGLLIGANVIDRYEAVPRESLPHIFDARTALAAQWLATPATYYWQASFTTGDGDVYAGPVRSLTVVSAPPPDPPQAPVPPVPYVAPPPPAPARPPLAATTARRIVRRAIAQGTRRLARRLTYRCTTAPGAATCRPSWRDDRYRYRGTLRINAGANGISATFAGTRSRTGTPRAFTFSASM
jgi:hypothetical protein